jgi:hypothetical protein
MCKFKAGMKSVPQPYSNLRGSLVHGIAGKTAQSLIAAQF